MGVAGGAELWGGFGRGLVPLARTKIEADPRFLSWIPPRSRSPLSGSGSSSPSSRAAAAARAAAEMRGPSRICALAAIACLAGAHCAAALAAPSPGVEACAAARRALGPPRGSFLTTSRGFTHYTLDGPEDGPLLVLSHGLGAAVTTFDFLVEDAAQAGFRVLRYDFYDRGWSTTDPEAYASNGYQHGLAFGEDVYVSQAEELLRGLGLLDRPALWVGHSTGAAVGIAYARKNPAAVRAMCLMGAAGLPVRKPLAARCADLPLGVGNLLTRLLGRRTFVKFVRKALGHIADEDPQKMEVLRSLLDNNPRYFSSIRSTNKHFPFSTLEGAYRDICARKTPILLVWGEADGATPFENCLKMEEIARAAGAPAERISFPDEPHNVHLSAKAAPAVKEGILRFAKRVM